MNRASEGKSTQASPSAVYALSFTGKAPIDRLLYSYLDKFRFPLRELEENYPAKVDTLSLTAGTEVRMLTAIKQLKRNYRLRLFVFQRINGLLEPRLATYANSTPVEPFRPQVV